MSMKQEVKRLAEQVSMLAKVVDDMRQPNESVCGDNIKAHSAHIDENTMYRIEDAELTASGALSTANAAHDIAREALNKQNQNQELTTAAFLLRVAQENGLDVNVGLVAQQKLIEVMNRL